MNTIRTRYAQDAPGHVHHIAPLIGSRVAKTALCGKQVTRWDSITDETPADCCQRCAKVQERRGWARALEIVRSAEKVGRETRR